MAINKNHEFEELNGIKCAIVEKNIATERVEFLQTLLQSNGYTVIIAASPPPKTAPPPKPPPVAGMEDVPLQTIVETPEPPPPPETFTLGVTDVTFNSTNAIFGRQLKTPDGKHVVTLGYWQQRENIARDDLPYFAPAG